MVQARATREGAGTALAGTQTVARTLSILSAFAAGDRYLGVSEIAHRLDLSPTTVHRILRALVDAGYLNQDAETERYCLGQAVRILGHAANQALGLDLVQPIIDDLVEATGESVNMGIREDREVVMILHSESPQALRISQKVGSRLPVYASGMGKVSLAFGMTNEDVETLLAGKLKPLTAKSIVSVSHLVDELDQIRERAYAIDDEEAIDGVRCVGVPIFDRHGDFRYALAIQGPSVRMSYPRLEKLAPLAQEAVQRISEFLPAAQSAT